MNNAWRVLDREWCLSIRTTWIISIPSIGYSGWRRSSRTCTKKKKRHKGVFRQEGYPSLCFNYSRRGLRAHRRSLDNSNACIRYLYLHARITEQTSSFKSSYANGWHLKQTLHEKRTYNKRLGFFFPSPAVKLVELFHIHAKASLNLKKCSECLLHPLCVFFF